MYYLFIDAMQVCKWCHEPLMQVVEEDPSKIIIKLCPICDKWPEGFMNKESR